ncbi:PTS sugar transporter subunit IIA [Desulfosporosinus fructosivorans]
MWPFGETKQNETETVKAEIWAPLSGKIMALDQVPDPVFANELLGPGLAIYPTSGEILAPFDGEVTALFPTGHAIGLKSKAGVECLIHCGIDTVELKGKGFKVMVSQGDKVKIGSVLIKADLKLIASNGKNLATPIVITNSDQWSLELARKDGEVVAGEDVLFLAFPVQAKAKA